jgi:DNA-binding beta-propeller fold protein YncE
MRDAPHVNGSSAEVRVRARAHHAVARSIEIINRLNPQPDASFSTVPPIGDVNPYGVAFVPSGFVKGGPLHIGDVLVENFNSSSNLQGTGTTIVDISPSGAQSVFYQGPQGLGLTTALGVLANGFVIVGNLPTTYDSNGNVLSIGQGSLLILNRYGTEVANLTDPALLDGPWDLAVNDQGNSAQVFVSNVLSGTVTRIDLNVPRSGNGIKVESMVQIASGYAFRTDPAALVVGPTGLAYDPLKGILYVASTDDNAIFAIKNAGSTSIDQGMGTLIYQDPAHLRGPVGLALGPNGDLFTTNGDAVNGDPTQPSELIEFTPKGKFVGQLSLDPAQGAAFGLAFYFTTSGDLIVATANDDTNTLDERFVTN